MKGSLEVALNDDIAGICRFWEGEEMFETVRLTRMVIA